jgi:hypothetical protein
LPEILTFGKVDCWITLGASLEVSQLDQCFFEVPIGRLGFLERMMFGSFGFLRSTLLKNVVLRNAIDVLWIPLEQLFLLCWFDIWKWKSSPAL